MLSIAASEVAAVRLSDGYQEKLVNDLLREYSRYVRPVLNETHIMNVAYHMKLSRILKIVSRGLLEITGACGISPK